MPSAPQPSARRGKGEVTGEQLDMSEEAENTGGEAGVQTDRARGLATRSEINQLAIACRNRRISGEERGKAIVLLANTIEQAKSYRLRIAAARALAVFDATDVRDQHHLERIDQENGILLLKQQRAEQGLPNDSLAVILPPTTQTPMPAWMERMKGECPQ